MQHFCYNYDRRAPRGSHGAAVQTNAGWCVRQKIIPKNRACVNRDPLADIPVHGGTA